MQLPNLTKGFGELLGKKKTTVYEEKNVNTVHVQSHTDEERTSRDHFLPG